MKDWRENFDHKSPLIVEVCQEELEEFMKEMRYDGEALADGAFAALANPPDTVTQGVEDFKRGKKKE